MKIKTNIRAGSGGASGVGTNSTGVETTTTSNSNKASGGGATSGGGRCAGY
jgi:hypothetical protein